MSDDFNPYHKWLGIPLKDQPADYYRLLGVTQFESDPDVITGAVPSLVLSAASSEVPPVLVSPVSLKASTV